MKRFENMTLSGAVFERFMNKNLNKPVKLHIKNIPDVEGILKEYNEKTIVVETTTGDCIVENYYVLGMTVLKD